MHTRYMLLRQFKKKKSQQGLSLIEILIVVTIVALLLLLALSQLGLQLSKARDGRRKSDLDRIKKAFEDYVGDRGQYPPAGILNDCDGTSLSPYLERIPCDPQDNSPYVYQPYPDATNRTGGFRVFARLEVATDPVVAQLGCNSGVGCGLPIEVVADAPFYNYGVSEGVPVYYSSGGSSEVPEIGICCPSGGGVCNVTQLTMGSCPANGGPYSDETECVNATPCNYGPFTGEN